MDGACITILMKDKLHDSIKEVLDRYARFMDSNSIWFTIEMCPYEREDYEGAEIRNEELTRVFGKFPEQSIQLCGPLDEIFIAAYEILKFFGGMLYVPISTPKEKMLSLAGIVIELKDTSEDDEDDLLNDARTYLLDSVAHRQWINDWYPAELFEDYKMDEFISKA